MHLARTRYLTCMHTGDRSADAIDVGQVLPGYEGVIVRDGYAGYAHLTSALHACCGVHYAEAGIMPRSWLKLLVVLSRRECGLAQVTSPLRWDWDG